MYIDYNSDNVVILFLCKIYSYKFKNLNYFTLANTEIFETEHFSQQDHVAQKPDIIWQTPPFTTSSAVIVLGA